MSGDDIRILFGPAAGAFIRGDRGSAWFATSNAQDFALPREWIAEINAIAEHELSAPQIDELLAVGEKLARRGEFLSWLNILIDRGLLRSVLVDNGCVLASRVGLGMRTPPKSIAAHQGSFRLSKFAYCRVVNNELVVESPTSASRVVLHDRRAAAAFCSLTVPFEISIGSAPIGEAAVRHQLATMLIDAGVMVRSEFSKEL